MIECIGCTGTGKIAYCVRCNYHWDDCKCDDAAITFAHMDCPNCDGAGGFTPCEEG